MTRKTFASLAVAAAALLTPQAASAADLYVGPNDGDADCSSGSPCTLWSAIQRADQGRDRDTIHVSGQIAQDVTADLRHSPIDVVGTPGARIDLGSGAVLSIGLDSTVSRLHVRAFGTRDHAVGIDHGGQLRDSRIEALDGAAVGFSGTGSVSRPARIERVALDAADGNGVYIIPSPQTVQIVDADIKARYEGVRAFGTSGCGGFELRSSTVVASGYEVVASYCTSEIANSVIRQTTPGHDGVAVVDRRLSISHSTIVGGGHASGVRTQGNGVAATRDSTVEVSDSIVTGFVTDLYSDGPLTVRRTSFGTSAGDDVRSFDLAPAGDPRFVDAAAGDYRLIEGSPLVDAGSEAQQGAPQTDRAGAPRFADGNGDGKAESDIGAYERPAAERPTEQGDQSPPTGLGPQGNPADETRLQHPSVAPAPPRFAFAGKTLTVNRQRQGTLPVTCTASAGACKLSVLITARAGKRTVTLGRARAAQFRLSRRAIAIVQRNRIRKVTVTLTATDPAGAEARATRAYRLRLR